MNEQNNSPQAGALQNRAHTSHYRDGDELVKLGEWYWVKDGDSERLGCVTHIGSNYAKIECVTESRQSGHSIRVHLDNLLDKCREEPNGKEIIDEKVQEYQAEVRRLMGRVKQLTSELGLKSGNQITDQGPETQALQRLSGSHFNYDSYRSALTKAKDDELPEIFEKIEKANEAAAEWMKARIFPMRAEAGKMKGLIESIEDRIFTVELYAGLTETIELICDGEPAEAHEKTVLMQRRHYMDEECLARYETGGMDFSNLEEFDEWIAREENLNRLLPFPKCVVSFKVRRKSKGRPRLSHFVQFNFDKQDEKTYLYIKNGERLYRMTTGIDFEDKLFPDREHTNFHGKLWAHVSTDGRVDRIITDDHYSQLVEEWEAFQKLKNSPEWEGMSWGEKSGREPSWYDQPKRFCPFNTSSVYFDDIKEHLESKIKHHNRIALILQGLFDRSEVLHPHPPVELWTQEGFEHAIELKYDADRALYASKEPPSFEEYRRKCNESLEDGSITIGQQWAWVEQEREKERERRRREPRYTYKDIEAADYWTPYPDPGPGKIAKVAYYGPQKKTCKYTWLRPRANYSQKYGWDPITSHFEIDQSEIFNISAYKPGDFKMFFDDPRTRADYIKWAPILLEAEEYHAGNRRVREPGERAPNTHY